MALYLWYYLYSIILAHHFCPSIYLLSIYLEMRFFFSFHFFNYVLVKEIQIFFYFYQLNLHLDFTQIISQLILLLLILKVNKLIIYFDWFDFNNLMQISFIWKHYRHYDSIWFSFFKKWVCLLIHSYFLLPSFSYTNPSFLSINQFQHSKDLILCSCFAYAS